MVLSTFLQHMNPNDPQLWIGILVGFFTGVGWMIFCLCILEIEWMAREKKLKDEFSKTQNPTRKES